MHKKFYSKNVNSKFYNLYGVDYNSVKSHIEIRDKYYPIYYFETDSYQPLYIIGNDVLNILSGRQVFLMLDEIFDYSKLFVEGLHDNFFVMEDSLPLFVVDLKKNSLQSVEEGIKLRSSYYKGAKYNELNFYQEEYHNIDSAVARFIKYFEMKQGKYNDSTVELQVTDFNLYSILTKSDKFYGLFSEWNNRFVYAFLCHFSSITNTLYGHFIQVTEDEEIRKKHRAYVLGHIEVMRFANKNNILNVEFGMYYPYKSVFGISPKYRKGIRYEER